MRVWDEERLLRQLAASREARTRAKDDRRNAKQLGENPVEFLLVLVRRFAQKRYEFLLIPASRYERLDQVYIQTSVVTANTDTVRNEREEDMEFGEFVGAPGTEAGSKSSRSSTYESHYVGKAIFHTASGEPLMKVQASIGWKEALKQKYINMDSKSRLKAETMHLDDNNNVKVKAIAAAALGGGAAAGGSTIVAANAAAAAATTTVSMEAFGAGSFAASGGFGAVTQTAGTVGIMATPVGMVAAAGALGGLGLYYVMHRRNKARKEKELLELGAQKTTSVTEKSLDEESQSTLHTEDDSGSEDDSCTGYQQLNDDNKKRQENAGKYSDATWVCLFAKKTGCEDSQYMYLPSVCPSKEDAEGEFQLIATNNVAKALFNARGRIVQVEVDAEEDKDGWGTALALHYDFLAANGFIEAIKDAEDTVEGTPLLKADKEIEANQKKANNWVFESIRKRRERMNQKPGTGPVLATH